MASLVPYMVAIGNHEDVCRLLISSSLFFLHLLYLIFSLSCSTTTELRSCIDSTCQRTEEMKICGTGVSLSHTQTNIQHARATPNACARAALHTRNACVSLSLSLSLCKQHKINHKIIMLLLAWTTGMFTGYSSRRRTLTSQPPLSISGLSRYYYYILHPHLLSFIIYFLSSIYKVYILFISINHL